MNNARRKIISKVVSDIESIDCENLTLAAIQTLAEKAKNSIEGVHEEEGDAYDNLPESLQDSEKGEVMQENIEQLETAITSLGDVASVEDSEEDWRLVVMDFLNEATESLGNIE